MSIVFSQKNAGFAIKTTHNGCLMKELAVELLRDKRSDFGDKRLMLANATCGYPTRSGQECQMNAHNSTGFGVVERAAAETPINREPAGALRRLQNDFGTTLQNASRIYESSCRTQHLGLPYAPTHCSVYM